MPHDISEIMTRLSPGRFDAQRAKNFDIESARGALRSSVVTRVLNVDDENRTVDIAMATDQPIEHWFGYLILDTKKSAVILDRIDNGVAPLLVNHDRDTQPGVIVPGSTVLGPVIRGKAKFSRTQLGEDMFLDVKDEIRNGTSVGFLVHDMVLVSNKKDSVPTYRATKWEILECSLASIPADIGSGTGRTAFETPTPPPDAPETRANTETAMPNNDAPETPAVVETRSPRELVAEEIIRWGRNLNQDELARHFAAQENPTVDAFMTAARERIPAPTPVAPPPPQVVADRAGAEVVIDRNTRSVVAGENLTDTQMNAIFSREYREAFLSYLQKKGQRDLSATHLRALAEGADSDGGFLVPGEFLAKMVEREPAPTELQSLVTNLQTGSDKLTMPKNAYSSSSLYTTGVRVSWVDEKTGPSSESDATDFGNITIPIHTAMMYHDVTNNMIEDSQFDILGWLAGKFRETADVVTENMIINGTGIGQPEGILLNPGGTDFPATVVSGDANLLKADGLIDLTYALLGRYINNARFVFNRLSAEKAIAKLKDSSNRYLFSTGIDNDGLAVKRPTELLGFPFVSSDFMPDVAANAYPVIFGDLKGYYLVRRVGFSIQILNEIVATSNKVRVLGRLRIGGQVAEDWRLKIQKVST